MEPREFWNDGNGRKDVGALTRANNILCYFGKHVVFTYSDVFFSQ